MECHLSRIMRQHEVFSKFTEAVETMNSDALRSSTNNSLPDVLSRGRTVEAWCHALEQKHGVKVGVRALKQRAREHGHFIMCGKQMLLLPEHVDLLLLQK
jgi:hypothetical protein